MGTEVAGSVSIGLAVFFLFRATQLATFLWRSRTIQSASDSPPDSQCLRDMRLAVIRAFSVRRAVVLTLLVSGVVTADQLARILKEATELRLSTAFISGSISEVLVLVTLSLAACWLFYAGYALFEARLSRLRMKLWEAAPGNLR